MLGPAFRLDFDRDSVNHLDERIGVTAGGNAL